MPKIDVKKLPKSEVEIEGEIEADIFETYFNKALKRIGEGVEIDGFRKGKVPKMFCFLKFLKQKFWEKWQRWL